MKLATFSHAGSTRIGVVEGEEVVDLSAATPELPREMRAFLEAGLPSLERARSAVDAGDSRLPLETVHLEAPIARPSPSTTKASSGS